ncbi:hypothetical protein G7Y79_00007g022530 [Physcia stellaris]|nr:hypothetical protein G7Y79_00007g022530 [Physcia stellaris]
MAESYSWVVSITARLDKLITAIRASQRSSSALASSELRESRKKVEVVLETSGQKFQVWTKTWLQNDSDPAVSAGELWGDEGWRDIQKLLSSVQDNARQIEDDLAKKDDHVSHLGWRRTLRSSLSKKNRALIIRSRPLIDLAVQLSRSIDELWTYSEVAFDSLHGMFSRQIGPPQRERLLGKSLNARRGALALYEACNQSKADYSLEVDLLGESLETSSKFGRRSSVSSKMSSGLFYHLFAANPEVSDAINGIIIESMTRPGEPDVKSTEAIKLDIMIADAIKFDIKRSDLAIYQSWPVLKSKSTIISIQSRTAYAPSYFRVPTPPVDLVSKGKMESLAQLLYKDRIASSLEERPMSQETRVQLAFKLVECGFYLLGTPWLASLSSKRLRRMKTSEGNPFVLEVQTLDLEDLYFEDPEALSERSQLFSIGVILVEIALSDERNPHNIQDPDLRKSKILPMVESSMGSLYCAATAFCLADRRSAPHFERPEKYKYPEESAWTSYLAELLEDYHGQVYSR